MAPSSQTIRGKQGTKVTTFDFANFFANDGGKSGFEGNDPLKGPARKQSSHAAAHKRKLKSFDFADQTDKQQQQHNTIPDIHRQPPEMEVPIGRMTPLTPRSRQSNVERPPRWLSSVTPTAKTWKGLPEVTFPQPPLTAPGANRQRPKSFDDKRLSASSQWRDQFTPTPTTQLDEEAETETQQRFDYPLPEVPSMNARHRHIFRSDRYDAELEGDSSSAGSLSDSSSVEEIAKEMGLPADHDSDTDSGSEIDSQDGGGRRTYKVEKEVSEKIVDLLLEGDQPLPEPNFDETFIYKIPPSRIPPKYYKYDVSMKRKDARKGANYKLGVMFPTDYPKSDAEVDYLRDAVDKMVIDLSHQSQNGALDLAVGDSEEEMFAFDYGHHVMPQMELWFAILSEICRQVGTLSPKRGELFHRILGILEGNCTFVHDFHQKTMEKLKHWRTTCQDEMQSKDWFEKEAVVNKEKVALLQVEVAELNKTIEELKQYSGELDYELQNARLSLKQKLSESDTRLNLAEEDREKLMRQLGQSKQQCKDLNDELIAMKKRLECGQSDDEMDDERTVSTKAIDADAPYLDWERMGSEAFASKELMSGSSSEDFLTLGTRHFQIEVSENDAFLSLALTQTAGVRSSVDYLTMYVRHMEVPSVPMLYDFQASTMGQPTAAVEVNDKMLKPGTYHITVVGEGGQPKKFSLGSRLFPSTAIVSDLADQVQSVLDMGEKTTSRKNGTMMLMEDVLDLMDVGTASVEAQTWETRVFADDSDFEDETAAEKANKLLEKKQSMARVETTLNLKEGAGVKKPETQKKKGKKGRKKEPRNLGGFQKLVAKVMKKSKGRIMSLRMLLKTMTEVLDAKHEADLVDDRDSNARQTLPEYIYDYFIHKYGLRTLSDIHVYELVESIYKYKRQSPRVHIFGRMCGMYEPLSQESCDLYLDVHDRLRHTNFGWLTEIEDGDWWCSTSRAVECIRGYFVTMPPALVEDLISDVKFGEVVFREGRLEDAKVNVDTFLDLVVEAGVRESERIDAKLEELFEQADADGNGILSLDEFSELIRKIDPTRTARQIAKIFNEALQLTRKEWEARKEDDPDTVNPLDEDSISPRAFALAVRKYQMVQLARHGRSYRPDKQSLQMTVDNVIGKLETQLSEVSGKSKKASLEAPDVQEIYEAMLAVGAWIET